MHKADTTAVILAGGRATRMGGIDKGLLKLAGKPLVAHVFEAIQKQVDEVVISANRNRSDYVRLGTPVLADTVCNYSGPLAGIASAMQHSEHTLLFVCPCDSPLIDGAMVQRLRDRLLNESADIAVAHDGERAQPVFALLRCSLLPSLRDFLGSGERKIMRWYQSQKLMQVDFSQQLEIFININTPEELDTLAQRLAKPGSAQHD